MIDRFRDRAWDEGSSRTPAEPLPFVFFRRRIACCPFSFSREYQVKAGERSCVAALTFELFSQYFAVPPSTAIIDLDLDLEIVLILPASRFCHPHSDIRSNKMDPPALDPAYVAADQRPTLRGIMWTLSIVPSVVVIVRIYVRAAIKKSFGWDDSIVIAATV